MVNFTIIGTNFYMLVCETIKEIKPNFAHARQNLFLIYIMQLFKSKYIAIWGIYKLQPPFACTLTLWTLLLSILLPAKAQVDIPEPTPPPLAIREAFELDPFYQQWIDVGGVPVLASAKVNPYAVKEAAYLIKQMIGHRQDLLQAMAENGVRFSVMAYNELTTQIPEHSHLRPKFFNDMRSRGLGGQTTSCGEENLLNYLGDPYWTENVLIHEFAHTLHVLGLNTVDPSFDNRLGIAYDAAIKTGLWQGTYASTDRREYWAEGAQSWFNINEENGPLHNHVNTRAELKDYDPDLTALLIEVFGDSNWRYTLPELVLIYRIFKDSIHKILQRLNGLLIWLSCTIN